jgi:hypothetical protein
MDGLNDISLGIVMILLSIYSITRSRLGPALNAIAFIGLVLIIVGSLSFVKSRLVPPRVGVVKFGPQAKKRLKNAVMVTFALVIAVLATWYLSAENIFQEPTWDRLPKWVTVFDVDIFFSLLTIALFSVLAYSFALPRFYLYGLLIGLGNLFSTILLVYRSITFQYPLAIAGLAILGIGVFLLIRFMRTYPIRSVEA